MRAARNIGVSKSFAGNKSELLGDKSNENSLNDATRLIKQNPQHASAKISHVDDTSTSIVENLEEVKEENTGAEALPRRKSAIHDFKGVHNS